jgi:hypothetical protein
MDWPVFQSDIHLRALESKILPAQSDLETRSLNEFTGFGSPKLRHDQRVAGHLTIFDVRQDAGSAK